MNGLVWIKIFFLKILGIITIPKEILHNRHAKLHLKNEIPVLESFGCETKTGVVGILVIFQDRPMFIHIIQKVSARASH